MALFLRQVVPNELLDDPLNASVLFDGRNLQCLQSARIETQGCILFLAGFCRHEIWVE